MHMHRSLPHRQLRNFSQKEVYDGGGSLPHRQLRKQVQWGIDNLGRSLPHRQLRNRNPGCTGTQKAITAA